MSNSKIAPRIVALGKQKIIVAKVIDVLGDRCSVQLSERGRKLTGLKYFGTKPSTGDKVFVDYRSGSPVVQTSAENLQEALQVAVSSSSSSQASSTLPLSPTESVQTRIHNDLESIQGGKQPSETEDAEFYHLTEEEYNDLLDLLVTPPGSINVSDESGYVSVDGVTALVFPTGTVQDMGYGVVLINIEGGSGTPGGNDTEIQVNEAGEFAGYPWLRVDPVNYLLLFGDGDPPILGSRTWHFVGDGVSPSNAFWAFGADYAGFHKFLKAGGTKAAPSALVNDTPVGRIRYQGYGATAWAGGSGVQVEGFATEDWDDSNQGMGWRVGITPRGFTWTSREWVFEVTEDGINLLGTSHYINKLGQEYVSYLFENAPSKVPPESGDKFGYWDEDTGVIVQAPWGTLEALFVTRDEDTNVTGAELETLTDGSNADGLHTHYKLGIYGAHGQGVGVPAGATRYLIPFINGVQSTGYSVPLPGGVIQNFFVRQAGNQPGSSPGDDMVVEIYSGPIGAFVATGIKVTFAGGSAGQDRTDVVHTYNHTDGHHVQVRCTNSSGSASSALGGVIFQIKHS